MLTACSFKCHLSYSVQPRATQKINTYKSMRLGFYIKWLHKIWFYSWTMLWADQLPFPVWVNLCISISINAVGTKAKKKRKQVFIPVGQRQCTELTPYLHSSCYHFILITIFIYLFFLNNVSGASLKTITAVISLLIIKLAHEHFRSRLWPSTLLPGNVFLVYFFFFFYSLLQNVIDSI